MSKLDHPNSEPAIESGRPKMIKMRKILCPMTVSFTEIKNLIIANVAIAKIDKES